jgi:hypothetical protein
MEVLKVLEVAKIMEVLEVTKVLEVTEILKVAEIIPGHFVRIRRIAGHAAKIDWLIQASDDFLGTRQSRIEA